jgi:hypothetical protein
VLQIPFDDFDVLGNFDFGDVDYISPGSPSLPAGFPLEIDCVPIVPEPTSPLGFLLCAVFGFAILRGRSVRGKRVCSCEQRCLLELLREIQAEPDGFVGWRATGQSFHRSPCRSRSGH